MLEAKGHTPNQKNYRYIVDKTSMSSVNGAFEHFAAIDDERPGSIARVGHRAFRIAILETKIRRIRNPR
jgi:hypothetical protein